MLGEMRSTLATSRFQQFLRTSTANYAMFYPDETSVPDLRLPLHRTPKAKWKEQASSMERERSDVIHRAELLQEQVT